MASKNKCVFCYITAVAFAVTTGFNEAATTEEPEPTAPARFGRSPQATITGAVVGANLQFIGQAARSGQAVLESKLSVARAMIEAGSDMFAAKVKAARDMAGVALDGGKTITRTSLGTISDTADGLAVVFGYPGLAVKRRKRDVHKRSEQRRGNDKDDDKSSDEDDDDGDKSQDEKAARRKRNTGKMDKQLTTQGVTTGNSEGLGAVGSTCMVCKTDKVITKRVSLKGSAVGGGVGWAGASKSGFVGNAGAATDINSAGAGLVGGIKGGIRGIMGITDGSSRRTSGEKFVGVGGSLAGGFGVAVRKTREARRFGGGRSRFSSARGGGAAAKKGQSDTTSSGPDPSGGASARLRQKRTIMKHVFHDLQRRKRQDVTTVASAGNGGKKSCHSFHSAEEDEEEKKFWENFHNMMNEHDDDWDFDFDREMCGKSGGSTTAEEGHKEATTPLPPTIDA